MTKHERDGTREGLQRLPEGAGRGVPVQGCPAITPPKQADSSSWAVKATSEPRRQGSPSVGRARGFSYTPL